MPPDDLAVLENIQRRVLWLSAFMVHHANVLRPNPDGTKIGGHQASSASVVSLMTALYFGALRAGDVVAVKAHASPVFLSRLVASSSGVGFKTSLVGPSDSGNDRRTVGADLARLHR